MIDVLRASTTIITALAHGAVGVRPVPSVAEAWALAAGGKTPFPPSRRSAAGTSTGLPGRRSRPRAAADPCGGPRSAGSHPTPGPLLGGERGGTRIEGFDLGNSPLEYSTARVAGREIVITTTNGTAALDACTAAAEVIIGAIVNRSAVAARARRLAGRRGILDVHLVCAGTDGHATEEDLLAAGAILDAAAAESAGDTLDRQSIRQLGRFRDLAASATEGLEAALVRGFEMARGGRNLLDLGMAEDLRAAASIDATPVVPRLDKASGRLVADGGE